MPFVNSNLITLKCVLFLFFGAIGSLFPFLPLHMTKKGLTVEENRIISIVVPCVALLGPAIAGLIADKLALRPDGKPYNKSKKYLRIMIALCFIISAILYWIMMAIPAVEPCSLVTIGSSHCDNTLDVERRKKNLPEHHRQREEAPIGFLCNNDGAEVIIRKCKEGQTCSEWAGEKIALLEISNCGYLCDSEAYHHNFDSSVQKSDPDTAEYDTDQYDENKIGSDESVPVEVNDRDKRDVINTTLLHIPHPHLCYNNNLSQTVCQVYSVYSRPLQIKVPVNQAKNDTEYANICRYPLGGNFHCRMGPQYEGNSTRDLENSCHPIIKCNVQNPVNQNRSVLIESPCVRSTATFWWYLILRSIADMFPAAAVALLDAAVIIATRETSTGRGDAGKQFAAGALGLAIFAPISGAINVRIAEIAIFTILLLIAALIMLFDNQMPLSPPEWWWHTRCGLLAVPMASIRRYGLEIAALTFVVLVSGIFWNGMDAFIPWHFLDMEGHPLDIGFAITVGALPAVLVFIYIENIIDYCGHSNILIATFSFYIIYYSALSVIHTPWLFLICEALDVFTLFIMWVTVVCYFRHLIPRKFTVSGQALLVIVHFCLARVFGTLIGGLAYPRDVKNVEDVYRGFAIAAAVVGIVYFMLYHFYLKPKYRPPIIELDTPVLIQSVNGNGTYTPLRIYHNSKALKGHYKY